MRINLAYGKKGLIIDLDDRWDVTVLEPQSSPGIPNEMQAVQNALRHPYQSRPLTDIVSARSSVGIVFNDITRATPNHKLLPAILNELHHVPADQITFFNALGTHRLNTESELRALITDELVDHYRIVQNDCRQREKLEHLGATPRGTDIFINKELIECDVKILTGFIEPHFFAAFSGGGKAVMPGMAGLDTILQNHGAKMIDDPFSVWGEIERNPIQQEIREIALRVGTDFIVNVTLNQRHQITNAFCGNLLAAHDTGCNAVRQLAMRPVDHLYDIVGTTNSGYPLDQNLYQSVKGMSAAAKIVKKGGAIIIASECRDGVPDHGLYKDLLLNAKDPEDLLTTIRQPDFLNQDQWEAQIQALVQQKADVYVYSDNLSPELLESLLLKSCIDIRALIGTLLQSAYGADATICVLPQGPLTIPYVREE
ncbi:nickel-dependent lactate racemase [candidate division KSB1 bacterium]|nr:nickel-dependent lactate racemase [candidate division KSB1 bacterium]